MFIYGGPTIASLLLDLRLPARAAFTFQNGVRHVGYVFAPQLNLDLRWPSATAARPLEFRTSWSRCPFPTGA